MPLLLLVDKLRPATARRQQVLRMIDAGLLVLLCRHRRRPAVDSFNPSLSCCDSPAKGFSYCRYRTLPCVVLLDVKVFLVCPRISLSGHLFSPHIYMPSCHLLLHDGHLAKCIIVAISYCTTGILRDIQLPRPPQHQPACRRKARLSRTCRSDAVCLRSFCFA